MKKLIELAPGKFKMIETHTFTNKSGTWESIQIVYSDKQAAIAAGNKEAVGNTVFVGMFEHEIDGQMYFAPGFNVWD